MVALPLLALAIGSVAYGVGQTPAAPAGERPPGEGEIRSASYSAPLGAIVPHIAEQPPLVDYARLDARIQQIMAEPDMVGLAVAVIEGGKIRFVKGYGLTRADAGERVTPNTVFRWASLSKSVAGTLVAELADEGVVSLDAPVASYGTTLRLPGGGERVVTVADVLAHRVGVVKNAYDEKLEEGQDPRLIRASLATLPPYCPPRSCHTYQNIAFDAATEVVERTTGKPYGDVAREKLFAPLGMRQASVGRFGLESAPSWARPHRGKAVQETKDAYYRVPAAGGVNSSIFDLAKWMRAQMGAGRVLSPELLATVQAPLVETPRRGGGAVGRALPGHHYGLGWRLHNYKGRELVGHRGAVDGYRSLILFDPKAKAGIAMLWNSNSSKPAGLQLEMLDMLYALPRQDWLALGEPVGGGAGLPVAR